MNFDPDTFFDFDAYYYKKTGLDTTLDMPQSIDPPEPGHCLQNASITPVPMSPLRELTIPALENNLGLNVRQGHKQSAKQLVKAKRITAKESKRKLSIAMATHSGSYTFKVPITGDPVPRPYGKLGGTLKANVAPPPGLPVYGMDVFILAPRWAHRRIVMWNLIRNGWTQHDMAATTNYYRGLDLKDNDICKHVTKAREVNGYQKDGFATMPFDEIQTMLQPSLDWNTSNWELPESTSNEIPAEDVTIYDLGKGVVNWPPDDTPFWSPLMCCAHYCQATGNQAYKLSDAAFLANSIGFDNLVDGVNHDAEFLKYIRETLPKAPRRQRPRKAGL